MTDVEGRRYLDCLAGYSALNFGHRQPGSSPPRSEQLDRLTLTSRAFHHDQFADVLRGARRALRQGHGAADEHRRRGRGDRDQGRPQVGLPGQGRARRAGQDHRGRGQLPRPHHHDRQLLHRPGRPRRLRAVHARVPHRALRRRRRDRARRSTRTPSPCCSSRSRARRACSCRRPATSPAVRAALHRARTCCSSPTRSSPGLGRTGDDVRLRPRGRRPGHVRARQGARRRRRAGLGGRPRTRTCSACSSPASTAPPSAATRSPARSAIAVDRPAAHRRVPGAGRASSASVLHARLRRARRPRA